MGDIGAMRLWGRRVKPSWEMKDWAQSNLVGKLVSNGQRCWDWSTEKSGRGERLAVDERVNG